ncbi:hypothetical protein AB0I94_11095 [Streptomyces sp. NPDC050147]|uniref:hypothetical protein n=1 Tax=Streptomyces sp. NPDC050147 TaxID=3155513 RepID=UPI00344505C8
MTQTSITSRNDGFSIQVASEPSPGEVAAGTGAVGRISVGDFEESFAMDLSYWSVTDYQESWMSALAVLDGGTDSTSCLISSITDPANSNFVFCWPIYREGDDVYVQNSIIFLEELTGDFIPKEPWRSVEPRSTVDEDGNNISEWKTSMGAVREFLSVAR